MEAGDCVWARTAEGWLGTDGKSYQLERKTKNSSASSLAVCQTSLPSPGTALTLPSPDFALCDQGPSHSALTRNLAHVHNLLKK